MFSFQISTCHSLWSPCSMTDGNHFVWALLQSLLKTNQMLTPPLSSPACQLCSADWTFPIVLSTLQWTVCCNLCNCATFFNVVCFLWHVPSSCTFHQCSKNCSRNACMSQLLKVAPWRIKWVDFLGCSPQHRMPCIDFPVLDAAASILDMFESLYIPKEKMSGNQWLALLFLG